jgi:GntR family galactonate operon transcriptional repressor
MSVRSIGLAKPRVHASVVREIALRILRGDLKPGQKLPKEAALQIEFGISRSAVREAVRVLAAKGLVETRPRTGTEIRQPGVWNRLDSEVLEWSLSAEPDLDFVRSLLEARRLIEPEAAELAALRASAQDVARIEAAYLGMKSSLSHDIEACCVADVAFHAAVLYASHNLVLRQLIGAIGAALGNIFRLSSQLQQSEEKTLLAHFDVLECIRLRDPVGARAAMLGLIAVAATDLAPLLERTANLIDSTAGGPQ